MIKQRISLLSALLLAFAFTACVHKNTLSVGTWKNIGTVQRGIDTLLTGGVSCSIGNTGYYHDTARKTMLAYAPDNTWRYLAAYPGAGCGTIGFAIGVKVYIGGGRVTLPLSSGFSSVFKQDFWEYDPGTNTWARKADLPGNSTENHVSLSIGAKGYFKSWRYLYEYDPATDVWTYRSNFPGGVDTLSLVAFTIGSKGYWSGNKDFWEYDPGTNTWARKADLPEAAPYVRFSIGNKGYIGGANFWEYDPATNVWTMKNNFPGEKRPLEACFSINGKQYSGGGGILHSGFIDHLCYDLWEFQP